MDMPNTVPNTLTNELLEEKYTLASKSSLANYSFFMGLTKDNWEETLKTDTENVCGVTDDGLYFSKEDGIIANYPDYIEKIFANSNTLIALHSENDAIIKNNTALYKQQYNNDIPFKYHALIRSEEACYSTTKKLIDIAKKYSLPIIVHTRDAWEDTEKILKANYVSDKNAHNGVIHCFTGSNENAKAFLELGFYISWSGVITFKKNDHFRETAKNISLERFLVETDSPYLAPQDKRGKRNEPSYVNYVVDTLSKCYQLQREEIVKQSSQNAQKLFSF
jgi:dihydroorotase